MHLQHPANTKSICISLDSVYFVHLSLCLVCYGFINVVKLQCPTTYSKCIQYLPLTCNFQACEKALLCFEMNIIDDPANDFVIEKIKKLKDVAVISASSKSGMFKYFIKSLLCFIINALPLYVPHMNVNWIQELGGMTSKCSFSPCN